MRALTSKTEYAAVCQRIEVLLRLVNNETPTTDVHFIELDVLSDLVADYEEATFPIETPTLIDTIKLRMFELGLNQKKLSELLNISTSRVSEYLTGKSEPTLPIAREISKKLDIDPEIVLGV